MSAFNWIVISGICPVCGNESAIRCQTHVASDYAGDDRGRFHDREYRLDETMWWWPRSHPRFHEWRINGRVTQNLEPFFDEEACYSTCMHCGNAICAVLRFHENMPIQVIQLRKVEDWPEGYLK